MFDTTIDQIKALRGDEEIVIVKLGDVTEIGTNGKARVRLYGDDKESNKYYNYIDGYLPEKGDKVALLPQGRTYIILGKVTDEKPEQKWALKDHNHDDKYLSIEYADELEDQTTHETVKLSNNVLLPSKDNIIDIGNSGNSAKMFKDIYAKKFYKNGEELFNDRLQVISGNNTYSLIATNSSGIITLTPSANDSWILGTSAAKLKEIWTNIFRGTWKSGQTTEVGLSWNSSNALVPSSSGAIDLGTASALFKSLFLTALIGAKWQYNAGAANNIAWSSVTELAPNNTDSVNLGSNTKQFNKGYFKEVYINGTAISPSGTTTDELSVESGSNTYTLKLSVKNAGASSQYEEVAPSVTNKFDLGASSMIFRNVYAATFHGDLDGALKDGNSDMSFDGSHNLIPSSTNQISLGTSSKQYKNIYGQNIYVNGSAVVSDRRKKEEIAPLDERYEEFFKALAPVSYRFKDGTSGRKHTGFIAQDVEQAAEEAGLGDKDIAVVVKDQEDNYYLRYEEIIAVQTDMIQKLMARVDSLEARVNKLESERSKT